MADEAFSDTQPVDAFDGAADYSPQFGDGDFGMGEADTDAPADGGQAEVEAAESAEPDVLDVNEFGDRMVTVKIDGEEQRVPLREAVNGYQRQADYTRSKQELARARAIDQMLQADPAKALKLLAVELDVDLGGQAAERTAEPVEDADSNVDPELRALRQQVEELSAWQTETLLDRTLAGLAQKYGDNYDEQALLVAAQQRGVEHPSELESVFRDLMFDKFYAQATAREQAAQSSAQDDAAREKAVRQVQDLVSSGNGVHGSASAPEPPVINSIDDAVAAAKRQLGL